MALRPLADAAGLAFGAAVKSGRFAEEADYAALLAANCNIVVPENAMKWGPLMTGPGTYDFAGADALVAFAERHAMRLRGHTLVWHRQLPPWIEKGGLDAAALGRALDAHIRTVVGRYRGRIWQWDVVNEAVADNGKELRDSVFLRRLGPDYIARAFRVAHEADPACRLFYNDYGAEGAGPKADRVYRLLQELVAAGVPVHGVGMQMHRSLGDMPPPAAVRDNMRRLAALGLEVAVTELDIRVPLPATAAAFAQQAAHYAALLELCLAEPYCKTVLCWGMSDRYSWVPKFFKGHGAALPFDGAFGPKPAAHAIARVLREAAGHAAAETGAKGAAPR